jgi:macrodomain Ter protein organizer (MatP/YcbG family)
MAHSSDSIQIENEIWLEFSAVARKAGKKPSQLLAELLRDFLDQRDSTQLVEDTVAAMKTPLTEDDDIEGIIRDLRKKRLAKT